MQSHNAEPQCQATVQGHSAESQFRASMPACAAEPTLPGRPLEPAAAAAAVVRSRRRNMVCTTRNTRSVLDGWRAAACMGEGRLDRDGRLGRWLQCPRAAAGMGCQLVSCPAGALAAVPPAAAAVGCQLLSRPAGRAAQAGSSSAHKVGCRASSMTRLLLCVCAL